MDRETIFDLIERERAYQNRQYPHRVAYNEPTPHIVILESYILRARESWVADEKNGGRSAIQQIAKIAAIAVRALEEISGAENAVAGGLR